jgi:flavodoxin I
MATAIFYASSTGNTADVASRISKQLGDIEVIDIADDGISSIGEYDKIIFATPTWGEGELQDDWLDVWDDFSNIDFSGKTVALFGLGDQDGYGEFYCDAMGIIYEKVIAQGGTIVGHWEIDNDYYHEASLAIKDGKFVGLALDEDNQDDLTDDRIEQWCEQIKNDIL